MNIAKNSVMSYMLCESYDIISVVSSQIMIREVEITDCVVACEFWKSGWLNIIEIMS